MIVNESDWKEHNTFLDSLEHHNRKNSKWYQHKFGKWQSHAKYAHGLSDPDAKEEKTEKSKSDAKKDKKVSKKEERAKKKIEAAKARAAKTKKKADKQIAKKEAEKKKIMSNPKSLYKHRNEFTYEEIQQAMKTFEWEQKLGNYALERDRQFKQRLTNGADYVNTMLRYTNDGIKIYNAAASIINTIQGEDKLRYIDTKFDKDKDKDKDKDDKKNKKSN